MKAGNVIRSAAVVSSGTMLSRILGLARLMLMAAFFGTSLALSAFVVAFRIPNLFRRLFGEGALSAAFVPVFTETLEKEGRDAAWRLATAVMTLLGTVLAGIVIVVVAGTTVAMASMSLGEKAAAVLPLLRIMFPYMFFICLVALCMGILNSFHHFAVPAFTPVVLNVIWILALVFVCPRFGTTPGERIYGVAWGILAAGVVQLLVQLPALRRYGYAPKLSFSWHDPKIKRLLVLMAPAALGMGVVQINVFVDSLLALYVGDWAPASLFFADMVVYLPLGVFATALGTVLLPTFSGQAAKSDSEEMKRTLKLGLRQIALVTIPASVGLVVLAYPVVRLLFQYREFGDSSVVQTARALLFYAPGLVVFSFYKVLVPAFYALQDTRTPMRVAVAAVVLNLVLNITFILTWPDGFRHSGLAFATVLSSVFSCLMLAWLLSRRIGPLGWGSVLAGTVRSAVAAGLMGVVVFFANNWLAETLGTTGSIKLGQLLVVLGCIVIGLVVYLVLAAILCRRELRECVGSFRKHAEKGQHRQG